MTTNHRILAFVIKGFLALLGFLLVLAVVSIQIIDRTPYQKRGYYAEVIQRIDSLSDKLNPQDTTGVFQIGWSRVNITPHLPANLAGYGARDPKETSLVHDSSYVRTLVFRKGNQQLAFISADLLVIHPEVSQGVYQRMAPVWKPEELFFTATHTHSGIGGWAPGIVGELFAGDYNPEMVSFLAECIQRSILQAEADLDTAAVSFSEMQAGDLVYNRLVKDKGITDPWLKTLWLTKNESVGALMAFSAHATCFGQSMHEVCGDYPAILQAGLLQDSVLDYSIFAAGAVGSMGPAFDSLPDAQQANYIAAELAQQLKFYRMLAYYDWQQPDILPFKIKIDLPEPQFKISENLALRPWLFKNAFGNYPHYISGAKLGNTLLIGLPCDFSGELAVPLYAYAREKGFNLFITSFNGDFAGYVIKDIWYDLPKYEARTMSWYGPDAGSYFSEIITRIIDELREHH